MQTELSPVDRPLSIEAAGLAEAIETLAVRAAYEGETQMFNQLSAVAALMRQGIVVAPAALRPQ
jgi:hypothetical protein